MYYIIDSRRNWGTTSIGWILRSKLKASFGVNHLKNDATSWSSRGGLGGKATTTQLSPPTASVSNPACGHNSQK